MVDVALANPLYPIRVACGSWHLFFEGNVLWVLTDISMLGLLRPQSAERPTEITEGLPPAKAKPETRIAG